MSTQRLRKTIVGVVTSDKMNKTVVVESTKLVRHPLYDKMVKRRSKYKAHDEKNQCKVGDTVVLIETRPLSRHKRWRVRQIVEERPL